MFDLEIIHRLSTIDHNVFMVCTEEVNAKLEEAAKMPRHPQAPPRPLGVKFITCRPDPIMPGFVVEFHNGTEFMIPWHRVDFAVHYPEEATPPEVIRCPFCEWDKIKTIGEYQFCERCGKQVSGMPLTDPPAIPPE